MFPMASSSQPTAKPSKRGQKVSRLEEAAVENDGVDKISNLPDCLLRHILSFLPTTESAATSILSSRWKTLWTLVPCLDIDPHTLRRNCKDRISFSSIVPRVFAQHKAPYIRKFRLSYVYSCDAFDVDTWVRAAISPNLEELDLCIFLEVHLEFYRGQLFELPRSLFSCKDLVVLKLSGGILLNLPSSFCFPSLKILHLCLTTYNNNDSDWRLHSGCPVLEDLVVERDEDLVDEDLLIEGEDSDEVLKFNICVPTLKRLKIEFIIYEVNHPNYELEINSPALEYFNFIGDLREVVFEQKLPNLVEANVDISAFVDYGIGDEFGDTAYYADKVLGLLRELYNVKFLSLSHGTIECLGFANDYELPKFHNLARLNYAFNCCNWHMLRYLLEQAPNLEVLVLKKTSSPSEAHLPVCLNVPRFQTFYFRGFQDLSPHLTNFYFRGFEGLKDDLEFVRCILKKARGLKTMTFGYGGGYQNAEEEKSRILKEVSNFPRRSMSCQIAFERGIFLMCVHSVCQSLYLVL